VKQIHPSITHKRVLEALDRYRHAGDNPGLCLACGADADGVEPDARKYICEVCDSPGVYGAEELLLMGVAHDNETR
jgi:hypothetical protein